MSKMIKFVLGFMKASAFYRILGVTNLTITPILSKLQSLAISGIRYGYPISLYHTLCCITLLCVAKNGSILLNKNKKGLILFNIWWHNQRKGVIPMKLIRRDSYLETLFSVLGTPDIKVITSAQRKLWSGSWHHWGQSKMLIRRFYWLERTSLHTILKAFRL